MCGGRQRRERGGGLGAGHGCLVAHACLMPAFHSTICHEPLHTACAHLPCCPPPAAVAETAPGRALALGRVVGSLCVLTAKDGDAEGAMLASWVSQVCCCRCCGAGCMAGGFLHVQNAQQGACYALPALFS